jgi:hypothetical protein
MGVGSPLPLVGNQAALRRADCSDGTSLDCTGALARRAWVVAAMAALATEPQTTPITAEGGCAPLGALRLQSVRQPRARLAQRRLQRRDID